MSLSRLLIKSLIANVFLIRSLLRKEIRAVRTRQKVRIFSRPQDYDSICDP